MNKEKINYHSLGFIRATKKCNQNCIFCNVLEKEDERFISKLNDIEKELDVLKQKGIAGIIISGGEPTLNKNLKMIIKMIKLKGFREIHLQTNGLLFSYEKFMNLEIYKDIDYFLIPLYSHDAQISDALTRTPGSFKLTVQAIKNLLGKNKRVVVNHVINKFNYKDIEKFCEFYIKEFNKKGMLSFSYLQPNGRARGKKDWVPQMSKVAPFLNHAIDLVVKNNILFKLAEGCPPVCFTPKYKDYHGEYEKLSRNEKDHLTDINKENKIKAEQCKKCKYFNNCLGVWKQYAEIYGTDELKPIIN